MRQAMEASLRADRFLARVRTGEIAFERFANWPEECLGKLEEKRLPVFTQSLESQTGRIMRLVLEACDAAGQI